MKIPLAEIYVGDDTRRAIERVLSSGRFVKGAESKAFEREFADFVGARHAVAVSSGTAAIHVTLQSLGVRPGDEVIVPSFSFVATASPLLQLGAKPVFVDIDPETYTMDPKRVKTRITRRTRGIVPVHLYGHPAEMGAITELARTRDLWVLEDACQAHGAQYQGKHVGTLGDASAFSFYPSKNMTVCGDGGMVVTDDAALADRARMYADAGRRPADKYVHRVVGANYRMSELSAAIGRVQLAHLPEWVRGRRRAAHAYTEALSEVQEVRTPVERPECLHSYYVYTVRARRRDRLSEHLAARGIATGLYYPTPIHRQPFMSAPVRRSRLPVTDRAAREVLSLPMSQRLAAEAIETVARAVSDFYGRTH